MRAAAFAVHIFTAMGAGIALLAMLEAVREHWANMFGWLGVALIIDAIDGPLARKLDVVRLQPNWSGEVLDLVVDFVTYVFVPAYAITASGHAAAGGRAAARHRHRGVRRALFRRPAHEGRRTIIFAAFRRCGTRRRFICSCCTCRRRFPRLGVAVLIALTFAPFHVVHPVRVVRLRWLTLWLLGVWAVLAIYTLACDFDVGAPIIAGLCAIAAYMVGSDAVIRLNQSRSRHDRITDQRGSLGGAADIDGAGNRARHRQRHLPVGDRLAHSASGRRSSARQIGLLLALVFRILLLSLLVWLIGLTAARASR